MITLISNKMYSPLYYPILVENRQEIQSYLCGNGIYASVLWKESNKFEIEKDADAEYIYSHILAIPCDQRYSKIEMDKIIHCIKKMKGIRE